MWGGITRPEVPVVCGDRNVRHGVLVIPKVTMTLIEESAKALENPRF